MPIYDSDPAATAAARARIEARLSAAFRAMEGREPRHRYFETKRGWMFIWTTERMGDGKYASAVYVPQGSGSQSGKARRWVATQERHHSTRTAAKARALRLYHARLATEATLRPIKPAAPAKPRRQPTRRARRNSTLQQPIAGAYPAVHNSDEGAPTVTAPAMKTCPGYGSEGAHDLPATTEFFQRNAPAKDGLFYQCKAHANAYQADWSAKRRAIAKADAMDPGVERDKALDAAYALPPVSKRKAAVDMVIPPHNPPAKPTRAAAATPAPTAKPAAAAKEAPLRTYAATGLAANTPRDKYVQEQGGKPGWGISTVSGAEYPVPTDKATVATPDGQAALEAVAAARRAANTASKRAQRAAAKAKEAAPATA